MEEEGRASSTELQRQWDASEAKAEALKAQVQQLEEDRRGKETLHAENRDQELQALQAQVQLPVLEPPPKKD